MSHFNEPPAGFRRISEKEFAQSIFFVYTPTSREYRQIHVRDEKDITHSETCGENKKVISVTLYHMHDSTGFGMESDYCGGKVHYYAFGCQHDYHELSQKECHERNIYHAGRCYHVSECNKCKHVSSVDSSD